MENEKTAMEIMKEAISDMCDNYCKYSNCEMDEEKLMEICDKCPLNRIM